MGFSIVLLIAAIYIAYRLSPREREEDAHIHGAGQIGLLAAVAGAFGAAVVAAGVPPGAAPLAAEPGLAGLALAGAAAEGV